MTALSEELQTMLRQNSKVSGCFRSFSRYISGLESMTKNTHKHTAAPAGDASSDGPASVYIVHVDKPEGEQDHEALHVRTIATVVGSEEAAREALVYSYKHAVSGFSAKLTPKQASEIANKPGVLQVTPDEVCELLNA